MAGEMDIRWEESSERQAMRLLDQIEEESRGRAITSTMRNVGTKLKNTLRGVLPKPGYPGDKPQFSALRDNIVVKVKSYQGGMYKVLVVGYSWPGGAHGQPLEEGHEKWLWGEHIPESPVEAQPYLAETVKASQLSINLSLIEGARKALQRAQAKSKSG